MRSVLILIVLLISLNVNSQESLKSVEIDPEYIWGNSEYWERDSVYFNLPSVKNSTYESHFRIYLDSYLIDLFSNNETTYSGIITTKITQLKPQKNEWGESWVDDRIYFNQVKIKDSLATNLALSIIESGQPKARTESFLDYWKTRFLHCSSIQFHFKIGDYFRPQHYSCPWGQDTTKSEVITVLNVYNEISEKLELGKLFDELKSELPRGRTYSNDGYRLLYLMTDKELKAWEKNAPRRDYLDSVKDTTISYLKSYLSEKSELNTDVECFETFSLKIGKDGYLNDISVLHYDKPKLRDGFKERKRVKNCERMLSKIFSKIDLSTFELEYPLVRTIRFSYDDKILVR